LPGRQLRQIHSPIRLRTQPRSRVQRKKIGLFLNDVDDSDDFSNLGRTFSKLFNSATGCSVQAIPTLSSALVSTIPIPFFTVSAAPLTFL